MDGWMEGWRDGWMDGCMYVWRDVCDVCVVIGVVIWLIMMIDVCWRISIFNFR